MSTDFDAVCDTCKQVVHAGQTSAGRHSLGYGATDINGIAELAHWLFKHALNNHVVRIERMGIAEPRPSDDYERVGL